MWSMFSCSTDKVENSTGQKHRSDTKGPVSWFLVVDVSAARGLSGGGGTETAITLSGTVIQSHNKKQLIIHFWIFARKKMQLRRIHWINRTYCTISWRLKELEIYRLYEKRDKN